MDKAKELKKVSNLEIPKMKGIMSSNPFYVLPIHELDNIADDVGVVINDSSEDIAIPTISIHSKACLHDANSCSNTSATSSSSYVASCDDEQQEDLAEEWIKVVNKSRGKHPKKFYK